jgi:hypothetical protein
MQVVLPAPRKQDGSPLLALVCTLAMVGIFGVGIGLTGGGDDSVQPSPRPAATVAQPRIVVEPAPAPLLVYREQEQVLVFKATTTAEELALWELQQSYEAPVRVVDLR